METALAPLKKALIKENLLEPDWADIVKWLERAQQKLVAEFQKATPSALQPVTEADVIRHVYGKQMGPDLIEELLENEKRRAKIKDLSRKLNLDRFIIEFFKGSAFFMEVSRYIRKTRATTWKGMPIPTAAMCYNMEYDDFEMVWNPEFFAAFIVDLGEVEGGKAIQFVYAHELIHFVMKHITVRRRTPPFAWNIGTDAANNSLLVQMGMQMLECGIYPSRPWHAPPPRNELRTGVARRKLTPEEEAMVKGLGDLIGAWPVLQSSEWYFNDLMRWANENNYKPGKKGISVPGAGGSGEGRGEGSEIEDIFGQTDIHDLWDDIPKEAQERISEKLREVMKGAARKADNEAKGWGNMPANMQKDIRAFINNTVDWETLLAQFFGSFTRGHRMKSMKRVNRKYPYEFAGYKRAYLPRLLIAIDQSGSVTDDQIALMFGVIFGLSKLIDFTIIFFDTEVDETNIVHWRRGAPAPKLQRTKTGGTDFNAPLRWVNRPEVRGKYDGICILTDGECYAPSEHTRIKKAWLITPGHKLAFETKETVIQMEESGTRRTGVIR